MALQHFLIGMMYSFSMSEVRLHRKFQRYLKETYVIQTPILSYLEVTVHV